MPLTTSNRSSRASLLCAAVLFYTVVIGAVVWHKVTLQPRTDDAEVFANFIGVAPQVDGPITRLYVKDNQQVKKGDLLLEIDERPFQYALARAKSEQGALEGQIEDEQRAITSQQAGIRVARSSVQSAESNVERGSAAIEQAKADVEAARAAVSRAESDYTYASNNLHRLEPLLKEQYVTVDQVDAAQTLEAGRRHALEQARSQLALSQAALQSANAQYKQAQAGLEQSHEVVEQSISSVRILKPLLAQRSGRTSSIDTAQYNLDNCRIYAPFDARVTNLTISEGAYAHTGQQIFTLIDTRTWWAIGNYRETQLKHIRNGMKADVYVLSEPNTRLMGTVESIGFGVTPDQDVIGRLSEGLPDVQRTLNWVHLASRFPVRVRISAPPGAPLRLGESSSIVVRGDGSLGGQ